MLELSPDDRLTPGDHVILRELSGESVLLNLRSGIYFGLNAVGTRVWRLITQERSLRDVNRVLCEEFEAHPSVVQSELLRFASELCAHDLCYVGQAEVNDGR
ncbi:MAG TPA: PqqD family protein [Vicinamibacterales bacterium]|jgi:hypothetical protein|nr:PqqD family protein [Vicinamibacterales bacterium]